MHLVCTLLILVDPRRGIIYCEIPFLDVALLLTVGSFLLTVELFYLQLEALAFLLTIGAFCLQF